jgi:hypothetical protein
MEHELRDIKPLLEIPDSSYYIYFGLVTLGLFVLLTLVLLVVKKFIVNRRESLAKRELKVLKEVDWSNAKKAAYTVTRLGRRLVNDKRSEEIYAQILPLLEEYKYKKEVPSVNDETLKHYHLLVHILDESI